MQLRVLISFFMLLLSSADFFQSYPACKVFIFRFKWYRYIDNVDTKSCILSETSVLLLKQSSGTYMQVHIYL